MAIPAGIGLFIAFLGLQNAGLVVDSSTLVGLASFNLYSGTATWGSIMPMLVTFFALLAIAAMSRRGVKGSVLFGILGGAVAYYILGFTVPGFYDGFAESLSFNPFTAFSEFAQLSFGKVFTEGFNFTPYIEANGMGSFVIMFITTALAFCMVDMFDTLGTLYGACARGGLLTKEGEVPHMDRAAGRRHRHQHRRHLRHLHRHHLRGELRRCRRGRTDGSCLHVHGCVLLHRHVPLAPGTADSVRATAAALIYVGVLMMNCVREIEWTSAEIAVPAFLTVAMMPFTYSISFGIAFGLISYTFIALFTGKAGRSSPPPGSSWCSSP